MCNFAANYSVYVMIGSMTGINKSILRALCVLLFALVFMEVQGTDLDYISINASKPTVVQDSSYWRVQDGWNYLQLPKNYFPAMIAYLPETAFGPIPSAMLGVDEELESQMVFVDCQQGWLWKIETTDEEMQLIIIEAHEEATIYVMPTIPTQEQCKTKTSEFSETVCDKYKFGGEWRTESGDYEYTFKTVEGCDSIVTLHLTVGVGCGEMYTIYYYKGMNSDHQEGTHWYQMYKHERPTDWNFALADYMEQGESGRTLMNLKKAETTLYNHYYEGSGLTPVENIIWSHRPDGEGSYSPVDVADEAQWIEVGVLAVRVLFLCGESWSSDFSTDVVNINAAEMPVKMIENGQVVIIRGGERYNILGTRLK